jgi:hypothetical protein
MPAPIFFQADFQLLIESVRRGDYDIAAQFQEPLPALRRLWDGAQARQFGWRNATGTSGTMLGALQWTYSVNRFLELMGHSLMGCSPLKTYRRVLALAD